MNTLRGLWRTTVGKKAVMALTGVVLFGWLLLHVSGNLLIFAGPAGDAAPALLPESAAVTAPAGPPVPVPIIDRYGAALHARPWLLWPMRIGLLLAVGLHLAAAVPLAQRARRARGIRRVRPAPEAATFAAHTMRIGGAGLAGFVVFHILHLTSGTLHPAYVAGGVHHNLVSGLRVPAVAALYLGAVAVLALHVAHGLFGAQRSLGLSAPAKQAPRRRLSVMVAIGLWAGFSVIPLAVLLGFLR